MTDALTTRCVRAAQLLKATDADYYLPVIRMLLAREQAERKRERKGKRVVLLAHVQGKSGRFYIDAEMLKDER